jgi:hypothetical protein
MSNQIITLTVPGLDQSDGPATNVSTFVGNKTVEISGSYVGSYTVLGSHDGLVFVPLLVFDSGSGVQSVRLTTNVVVKFMKVRRKAQNLTAVTIAVAGLTTATNSFIALAPIPAGTNTGPQPSTDVWAVVPPTGIESGLSAICSGNFIGGIALEGSLDNINFSPIEGGFLVGSGSGGKELSPLITGDTVRFVRLNVQPGTRLAGPVSVTIGGGLAPSGGGGGVTLVHSGVAISVDNTDPTNPIINNTGVTSYNGATGAVTGVASITAGAGINVNNAIPSAPVVTNTGVLSWNGSTGVVKGTLANIYAFGVIDSSVTDNTLAGVIDSIFFDPSGRINVTTNAGQEANTDPFVNLSHNVLGQANQDFTRETVRYLAASGVAVFAASIPTGWRKIYDLILDASASTIHVAVERIVTGNSTIGGSWWFDGGGIAPTQSPIVAKEVQLVRPDGVSGQISQQANNGTYAAQVFIPSTSATSQTTAAFVSIAVGDGGNPPPAGTGIGWFIYAGFGTLPLLGMLRVVFDDTGGLTEKSHWEMWGTINDVPTKMLTVTSTTLTIAQNIASNAATALNLTGNAASTWSTSAGGITIRANTGGVLGVTSTQISMSGTAADITVVGNLVGAAGSTAGVAGDSWDNIASKNFNVDSAGAIVADLQSGGLSMTAAATQSISKSGGLLFIQTTSANDVVFRANSVESYRITNASGFLSWQTGVGLTAPGAVAVAITNAPAGVGATPAEYLKVLGTGGATRFIPLLG